MDIEFTTIARGIDSDYQSASQTVINSSERWSNLWRLHTYDSEPPPPIPEVNFARYSVVAAFAGEKPTGGYSIEIVKAEASRSQAKERSSIVIIVQQHEPKDDEFVTEGFTYPYHMIKISKLDENKIVFKHI